MYRFAPLRLAVATAFALAAQILPAAADDSADIKAISSLLQTYEAFLNDSDVEGVMALYAPDGVFMPQHSPSAVGTDTVRQAYEAVFAAIDLEIEFDIVEIVPIAQDWAFARTNSSGTVTVLANGQSGAEANQELFILSKGVDDGWKIARYAFSTTNPPRQ